MTGEEAIDRVRKRFRGDYKYSREWIKKDEVMDIIKGLPQDLWEEYIYMLKGVWCDEDMHTDFCPNCGAKMDKGGDTE